MAPTGKPGSNIWWPSHPSPTLWSFCTKIKSVSCQVNKKSSQFHWKIHRFMEFAMFSAIVRWVSPLYSRQEQCRANMMVNSFNFKSNYSSTCFIIAAETDQVVGPIDGWAISSESCAFLPIGAHLRREVLPGEIVELSKNGLRSIGRVNPPANKKLAFCIFEYVYFARADSYFEGNGHSLHKFA